MVLFFYNSNKHTQGNLLLPLELLARSAFLLLSARKTDEVVPMHMSLESPSASGPTLTTVKSGPHQAIVRESRTGVDLPWSANCF